MSALIHSLERVSLKPGALAEARAVPRQAAEIRHLRDDELTELIDHLTQGMDWGSDELDLDFIDDQLRVTFHDLEAWCAPEPLIQLLRQVNASLPDATP